MSSISRLICVCIIGSAATIAASASAWNGLMPLHSTRSEVIQKLGPSEEPNNEWSSLHKTASEIVFVMYATGPPCGAGGTSVWKVPKGTVISITVRSKNRLLLSALTLDLSKFERSTGGHVPGYVYFSNRQVGMSIEVYGDDVTGITYFAGDTDAELRCCGVPT